MQNPSQQFLWFLITKLDDIRKMRASFGDDKNLGFVYADLAIQVLDNESESARTAALRIQPTTFRLS